MKNEEYEIYVDHGYVKDYVIWIGKYVKKV